MTTSDFITQPAARLTTDSRTCSSVCCTVPYSVWILSPCWRPVQQDIWDVLRAKKSKGIWVGCASRPRKRTARDSAPFGINIVEVFSRVRVEISCRTVVHEPYPSLGVWRFASQRFWQWFFQEVCRQVLSRVQEVFRHLLENHRYHSAGVLFYDCCMRVCFCPDMVMAVNPLNTELNPICQ